MKADLIKTAAQKLLQLNKQVKEHEKRAHALRLMYKQAEMGCCEIPRSYGELQEKLAALCTQDLAVVEKALELTGGTLNMGTLGLVDPQNMDAATKFQTTITDELQY